MNDIDYLAELGGALRDAGIHGGRRARILMEFEEHLLSNPDADLGDPRELAAQFADELGSDLARSAAIRAFAALALAGVLFAIAFVTGGRGHSFSAAGSNPAVHGLAWAVANSNPPLAAQIAMAACLVAVQVSVVAGVLGLLRAIRLKGHPVVATQEAAILVRRAGVALGSGAVTMLALPLVALSSPGLSSGWKVLAFVLAGVGLVAIASAVPAVRAALRLKPRVEGRAGDLLCDLDVISPVRLPGSPWQLAVGLALGIVVVLTAAGLAQSDPFDGALRGIFDGLACLAGFGLLGRYLGLRTA